MNGLRNWRVGTKIRNTLMVTFVLMILIASVGLYYITQLNNRLDNLIDVLAQKIILSTHIRQDLLSINIAEQDIILANTVAEQDKVVEMLTAAAAEINEHVAKLKELATVEEEKTNLFQFEQAFQRVMAINQQVLVLQHENSNEEAARLNLGDENTLAQQVELDLDNLDILLNQDLLVAEKGASFDNYREVIQKLFLLAQVRKQFESIRWQEKNLILAGQQDVQIKSEIDNVLEELSQVRLKLAALLKGRYDNEIGNFTISFNQWKATHQKVAALAVFNSNERAMQLVDGEAEPAFEEALQYIDTVVTATESQLAVARDLSTQDVNLARAVMIGMATLAVLIGIILGSMVSRMITQPLARLVDVAQSVAKGDLSQRIEVLSEDEVGLLGEAFNQMTTGLAKVTTDNERQIWLATGREKLATRLSGLHDLQTLAKNTIDYLCKYVGAQVGTLFILEDMTLRLVASYAYTSRKQVANQFQLGEGLVGQAALEMQPILLTQVPDDYMVVNSSLGEVSPRQLLASPFLYDGHLIGLVELGMLMPFTETQRLFIEQAMDSIGIAFYTGQAHLKMAQLLAETQKQAEQLRVQEEELRATNEELEVQAQTLRESEGQLRTKQTELERVNAELEEQAAILEHNSTVLNEKQTVLDEQNQNLKVAQTELEQQAAELTLASQYKSEFLANMSHELRTPLNSLLILARMLSQNEEGNLSQDQIESAKIIFNSGQDLLNLINDILDLSKVEAGKMEFHLAPMPFAELVMTIQAQFNHLAQDKGLAFNIITAEDLPSAIETDKQRVAQIIKNLLANAFKFTQHGGVTFQIHRPEASVNLSRSGLQVAQAIAFSVTDTGIGIPLEKQKVIFEAFQQADGSTSRQYGGTGLGLSIARELALKLGGQINLVSTPGEGSTFTLYLPNKESDELGVRSKELRVRDEELRTTPNSSFLTRNSLPDDRELLQPSDKVLLIIEDDPHFAKIVYDISHKRGFRSLIALDGQTGLQLVKQYPPLAIILDLRLPDMSGWQVLEWLKNNPDTRHIPVHIMSVDDETVEAYKKGAMGYLTKPVLPDDLEQVLQKINQFTTREIKNLLLVEDESNLRQSLKKLLGGSDVKIQEASSGQAALALLHQEPFDCMILDLKLPDMTGFELLNELNHDVTIPKCPVIVYTGKALSEDENRILMQYTDSVIVKGVKSPERLLDETALFLHRVVANMPPEKQATIKQLYIKEDLLVGKRVLIVDDDMRNSFALSKVLSEKGMVVEIANNGQRALEMLGQKIAVDVVLMDVMMPIMDGFEAIRLIRQQPQFKSLPILALTAKAMKGDREKCLAAGANDYMSKPIDTDRLFSMLRVWLYQ